MPASRPALIGNLREAALVCCAALLAYWPVVGGGLLWDDVGHITRADLRSVHGLWRIWFEIGATQQYYPLLHSAFWVEHRLWGDSLVGYHLANIALHSTSAFLLVRILRRLNVPGALVAGLIFALHPVYVESVAWISEQKNTLSGVFYLGAALAYLRFDERRDRRTYWTAFGLFLLALLSKTVTATLPAALLVIAWWRRGNLTWIRDGRPLVPWLAVGTAAGLFTAWFEREMIGAQGADFALTLAQRTVLAGRTFWFYLGKLLWPVDLMFIYPRWAIDSAQAWQFVPTIAAVAIAAGLVLIARRNRAPLAGYLFFAGTLFPVLGFFDVYPFRFSYVADHFQYLASLGVIVPVAAGLGVLLKSPAGARRTSSAIACAALVAVLGFLTWKQSAVYASAESLYRETVRRNPGAWMAYLNLGTELGSNPNRLADAAEAFEAALRLKPDHAQARRNLALAHAKMAAALAEAPGRTPEAIHHLREALRLDPQNAPGYVTLGDMLAESHGGPDEAVAAYRAALEIDRDYFLAHYNLGTLLLDMPGRQGEALTHLEAAARIRPDSAEAHANLGVALADAGGRAEEAIRHLDIALAKRPDLTQLRELRDSLRQQAKKKGDG